MEAEIPSLAATGGERPHDVQSTSTRYRVHVAFAENRHRVVACCGSTLDATGENEGGGGDH